MSIRLNGSTSGYVEIDAPAVAGSTSITLPATSGGEVVVTDSSGNIDLGPLDINGSAADDSVNIDGSGRLLVGTSSSVLVGSATAADIQVASAAGFISQTRYTNSTGGSALLLGKSRSETPGTYSIVSNGDDIGSIVFAGDDGTDLKTVAAIITAEVDDTPGANDMPGRLVFSTNGGAPATGPTERMRIRADGTVATTGGFGIGNITQAIANSFYIASTAIGIGAGNSTLKYNTSSGLVSYDTSSALVKENIIDCPYGIDAIKQLQPRKYFRIDDQREEIGFVADEVVNVLPEYVPVGPKSVITKDESDTEEIPLGVHYDKLTAVLTKALQEAITKIETLEATNASFEARLTALEGGQP